MSDSIVAWKPRIARHEAAVTACGSAMAWSVAVRDATAYLSVLVNPQDATSLLRIANRPRRGIGDTSMQRLVAHAEATGRTLFQAMADPEAAGVTAASCRAIRGFHATMESLMALSHDLHVDELLERARLRGRARGARPRGGRARAP